MSQEETNKRVVHRWLHELWEPYNYSIERELIADDLIDHNAYPGQVQGLEGHRNLMKMWQRAFPNPTYDVHHILAEGDLVSDFWTFTAKHEGELLGVPATGKVLSFRGGDVNKIRDGKIVEMWHIELNIQFLRELGVVATDLTVGS